MTFMYFQFQLDGLADQFPCNYYKLDYFLPLHFLCYSIWLGAVALVFLDVNQRCVN